MIPVPVRQPNDDNNAPACRCYSAPVTPLSSCRSFYRRPHTPRAHKRIARESSTLCWIGGASYSPLVKLLPGQNCPEALLSSSALVLFATPAQNPSRIDRHPVRPPSELSRSRTVLHTTRSLELSPSARLVRRLRLANLTTRPFPLNAPLISDGVITLEGSPALRSRFIRLAAVDLRPRQLSRWHFLFGR
jgi:hypothetical protein